MWLQRLQDSWRERFDEGLKAFIIIFVTIFLTALALLLASSYSEQRKQNLLTTQAHQYQSLLMHKIASDEEQLFSLARTLANKSPPSYKKLFEQILSLQDKDFVFVEIRNAKGKLLASQLADTSTEALPADSREELSPAEVINFFKAIEQQKIYWSLSYSPSGQTGVELIVPVASTDLVLVARTRPKHFLPPHSGIPIEKNVRIEFESSLSKNELPKEVLALPLELKGLNVYLLFSFISAYKSSFDYSFFLVIALGLGLCVLILSYANEARKNKSMQQRLSEQEKTLAKQAQLSTLGEISTTLAHELNQPLATITNYIATCEIRLQQLGFQDNVLNKALNDARGQTLRAGEVVQSIRNYLKKGSATKANVAVEEAIMHLQPILNALTKERRSSFKLDLDPSVNIRIDPALFEQIVLNLCKNALDAMQDTPPAKRHLLIKSWSETDSHDKRWVHIDVVDNGHGISEENAKKLFESFFTTKTDGMGIGLSLSRSVTESHGGKIAWANNSGGGATFSIILPQHAQE